MYTLKLSIISTLLISAILCHPHDVRDSREDDELIISPPLPGQVAKMARYIINTVDWVSLATVSTLDSVKGYPFATIKSISDGPVNNGSGIPYFYVSKLDVSIVDLQVNNKCTIVATLAQTDFCKNMTIDPEDPLCAKVMISGKFVKVDNSTEEYNYARDNLFSRHPEMNLWPANHGFYVAKIDLEQIAVLDFFGGIKYPSVQDYLNANFSQI